MDADGEVEVEVQVSTLSRGGVKWNYLINAGVVGRYFEMSAWIYVKRVSIIVQRESPDSDP